MRILRTTVYKLIDGERDYQDKLNADGQGRILTAGEELCLIQTYVDKARRTFAETFGDDEERPTMDVIRKIAALCVRTMEHHRAPQRI